MDPLFTARAAAGAIPIWFVSAANYPDVRQSVGAEVSAFADAAGFEPKPGRHLLFPGKPSGKGGAASGSPLGGLLFGIEGADEIKDAFLPGRLPQHLPDGVYRFAKEPNDARLAALAFALRCYRFTRYRKAAPRSIKLNLPQSVARDELDHLLEGVTLARDLINMPANDMGPAQLDQAARKLAARHAATITAVGGDELFGQKFSLIPAVGRAAAPAPRALDISLGGARPSPGTPVGQGGCLCSHRVPH